VYENPYGYVWVPVITQVDWRPYLLGRWVWYPRIGWTWISAEPWGWAVYHYGRWHWRLGLGWYWIPTVYWGPAWVHWYWDSDLVAWCPLSYWNRPVVIINNYFYDRYNDPYYPVHSRALVIVRRNELQAPHRFRTLIGPEHFKGVEKIRLEARQPQIKPVSGPSLRVPGLRARVPEIRKPGSGLAGRLSSSNIKSGQGNSLNKGTSRALTKIELTSPSSPSLNKSPNSRVAKSFSASTNLSPTRLNSDEVHPVANKDSLGFRSASGRANSEVSSKDNRTQELNQTNLSQSSRNDKYGQRAIAERPSSSVRKNDYSGQDEIQRRPSQVRYIGSYYSNSNYSRSDNLGQPYSPYSTEGLRSSSSLGPGEKKSSYNLPSFSRPYSRALNRNSVENGFHSPTAPSQKF
ncbi:MAG: DUF6600 domain-containing protein, partial [Candidatus Saccharicenans sp.]